MLIGTWDYEAWRREHLEDYVLMCEEFAADNSGTRKSAAG
jgi:hypothetical protein